MRSGAKSCQARMSSGNFFESLPKWIRAEISRLGVASSLARPRNPFSREEIKAREEILDGSMVKRGPNESWTIWMQTRLFILFIHVYTLRRDVGRHLQVLPR